MHITYIIKLLSIQRDVDGGREREQWSRGYTMEQQTRMHAYDRFFFTRNFPCSVVYTHYSEHYASVIGHRL